MKLPIISKISSQRSLCFDHSRKKGSISYLNDLKKNTDYYSPRKYPLITNLRIMNEKKLQKRKSLITEDFYKSKMGVFYCKEDKMPNEVFNYMKRIFLVDKSIHQDQPSEETKEIIYRGLYKNYFIPRQKETEQLMQFSNQKMKNLKKQFQLFSRKFTSQNILLKKKLKSS